MYRSYGSGFIHRLLKKFVEAPLFYLSADLKKGQRISVLKHFVEHTGSGKHSAILVLDPGFSTGIDLKGGVREMHILNQLSSEGMVIQARGRVLRRCGHQSLPKPERVVTYFQYKLAGDAQYTSCDVVIENYRQQASSVTNALNNVLIHSSFACREMARFHGHEEGRCTT